MQKYRHLIHKPAPENVDDLHAVKAVNALIGSDEVVEALCGLEFAPKTMQLNAPLCRACECVFTLDEMPKLYAEHGYNDETIETIMDCKMILTARARPIIDTIVNNSKRLSED